MKMVLVEGIEEEFKKRGKRKMVLSSVDRSVEKTIKRIDWQLLQRQKKTIEKLVVSASSGVKSNIPAEEIDSLWGLIELIENLQDIYENEPNNIVHFEWM